MFAYIKGKLTYKCNDYIVVETGGIGYMVYAPLSTVQSIGNIGDEIIVYTYMHVREDALVLYGFATRDELGMFELLISVTGIGPKAAISLISSISPSKFGLAVITGDVRTLTEAPGIGKKTAQRIILELKDKINSEKFIAGDTGMEEVPGSASQDNKRSEAVSALMVLGYTAVEANKAVTDVYSEDMDVETIIKNALKKIAGG